MSQHQRPPAWSASDRESFAFESTAKRWPIILTQAVDALFQAAAVLEASSSAADTQQKVHESKTIIEQLSKLKHDIGRDRPLEPLRQDSGPDVKLYNSIIEREQPTWFSAAWLFAECYLYRLVRSFFDFSQHWKSYDPFSSQKLSAFRSSGAAIEQLSQTLEKLIQQQQGEGEAAAASSQGVKMTFFLLAQSALWGNATDLSLLTSLSHADIQTLQAGGIGADAQKGREKFILSGLSGLDEAWKRIEPLKASGGGRVDIVLDNSGFELITDLMLGQWLVATGHADEVVFHAKAMPWFVSDVTPPDFAFAIEALQETRFFEQRDDVDAKEIAERHARARSSSRNRFAQADLRDFSGGVNAAPAGSRSLQYQPEGGSAAKRTSESPAGSRVLQAKEGEAEGRGRPSAAAPAPAGSRSLQMDPAYFQSSRSRTVSPSRSFLVDSTALSFSDLAIVSEEDQDGEERRGRRPAARPASLGRSASGFRSVSRSNVSTATQRLASTWASYLRSGHFKLSVPPTTRLGAATGLEKGDFWTEGVGYDAMHSVAPALLAELREKSNLVIFKGDLNYRKLTGDLRWPATTPFETALGDLAGKIDLLALRTCKADVVVGLGEGVEERVAKEDDKWRVNGKYAVVQFAGKKA